MKSKLKIGLTGSTGFVGMRLSKKFLMNNLKFYSYGRKNNPYAEKNIEFNLSKELNKECKESLKDIDVFIHMASKTPSKNGEEVNLKDFLSINVLGTEEIIKNCLKANVKEFIYISSANLLKPIQGIVSENSAYGDCVQSPYYLSSKISAEIIVKSFQCESMNIKIIRPSSIYGYGMQDGLIKIFLNKIFSNEKIKIYGKGKWGSDLVYVEDVVNSIYSLIFKDFSGPINIGSGKITSTKEIAFILCKAFNCSNSLISFDENIKELNSLPIINIKMAEELIKFKPIKFENGIELMIKDFLNK